MTTMVRKLPVTAPKTASSSSTKRNNSHLAGRIKRIKRIPTSIYYAFLITLLLIILHHAYLIDSTDRLLRQYQERFQNSILTGAPSVGGISTGAVGTSASASSSSSSLSAIRPIQTDHHSMGKDVGTPGEPIRNRDDHTRAVHNQVMGSDSAAPFQCDAPTTTHHAGTASPNAAKLKLASLSSSSPSSSTSSVPSVAFLFLMNGEDMVKSLWEEWFPPQDDERYTIWVHSKASKQDKTKKKRDDKSDNRGYLRLSRFFCPYAIPEVPSAHWWLHEPMMQLLQYAYHNTTASRQANQHFVFVSATSVPLISFERLYEGLQDDPKSRVCLGLTDQIHNSWNVTTPEQLGITVNDMSKASQWSILTREHVKLLLENETRMQRWNRLFREAARQSRKRGAGAPDELFVPTVLRIHGQQTENQLSKCHGPIREGLVVTPGHYSGCCSHFVQWIYPTQDSRPHIGPGCVARYGTPPNRPCVFNFLKLKGLRQKVIDRNFWFIRKVTADAKLVLEDETRVPLVQGLKEHVWNQ